MVKSTLMSRQSTNLGFVSLSSASFTKFLFVHGIWCAFVVKVEAVCHKSGGGYATRDQGLRHPLRWRRGGNRHSTWLLIKMKMQTSKMPASVTVSSDKIEMGVNFYRDLKVNARANAINLSITFYKTHSTAARAAISRTGLQMKSDKK